jgi:hypothetical protein
MGNLSGPRSLGLSCSLAVVLTAFGLAGGCERSVLPNIEASGSGGSGGGGGTALPPGDSAGSGGSGGGSSGADTFTLDLALADAWSGIAGPPVISHNAAIVLPIDVSEQRRVVTALGPGTAFEAQTKATCASPTAGDQVSRNVQAVEDTLGPLPALGGRHVARVSLKMPYRIPGDDYTRIPEGLCVLVRQASSRDFTLVPGRTIATLDDAAQMASAVLPVDQTGVDALAVLSETTISVSEITIELR